MLSGHCDAIGRNYDEIRKTYNCEAIAVARTEAEAKRISEASPFQNAPIYGTPQQVADQLNFFVNLGVDQFAVRLVDFPQTDGLQMFIEEVIPLVGK